MVGVSALVLFGLAVNLYFGRRGFLPLDQSVVFDGGWRQLTGQFPFRDFVAPNGLTPSAMQVPFFRIAGVTWFALCLHASVINGLACAAVFVLLRLCGSTLIEAGGFGALTAFFFYPPTGTPFTDQHAFFFTLLMLLAAVIGSVTQKRVLQWLAWLTVPPLFTLGYLSCQVPTAFGAVCIAVWVGLNARRSRIWIAAVTAGSAVTAVALLAMLAIERSDLRTAWSYVVLMPLETGTSRTPGAGPLHWLRLIGGSLRRLPGWARLWSLDLAIALSIAAVIGGRGRTIRDLRFWALCSAIFLTGAFVAYSKTPVDAALGLAMLIVGLATLLFWDAIADMKPRTLSREALRALVFGAAMLAAAIDTVSFVKRTDSPRMIHAHYDPGAARRARGHLPASLSFLAWSRGYSYVEPDELNALVTYLRAAPGNFLLIGDSTILYGLAGKPSVMPALWLDEGLSVPRFGTAEFDAFDNDVVRRLDRFDVRRLVLEGHETMTHFSLDSFPRLARIANSKMCGERRFGGIRVIELCRAGADDR